MPAGEQATAEIQLRNPTAAILAVGPTGAGEPGALAAEAAWRPGDRHALFDVLPVATVRPAAVVRALAGSLLPAMPSACIVRASDRASGSAADPSVPSCPQGVGLVDF